MRGSLTQRSREQLDRRVLEPLRERTVRPFRRWRNATREFDPVFVAGAMGSGTSLLALSLGQSFETACVIYESARWISPCSFLHTPNLAATYPDVAHYVEALRDQQSWSVEEGRRDLLALYRSRATGRGSIVIDKGPNSNLVRAAFLRRCFPGARFLLIFREPVANVEGYRRKWPTFGNDRLDACMDFHEWIHEEFLCQVEPFAADVATVEYEAFVEQPDEHLERLGEWLGLTRAGRGRRLKSVPNVEGQGIRNVSGRHIGVVKDATVRAQERMPAGESERVRERLAPLYARLKARTARP